MMNIESSTPERIAKIIRKRAVGAAGEAVFHWRGAATIYGEEWIEGWVPFDEIVVSPSAANYVHGELLPPPIELRRGRIVHADWVIDGCDRLRSETLPAARAAAISVQQLDSEPVDLVQRLDAKAKSALRRIKSALLRIEQRRLRLLTVATQVMIEYTVAGRMTEHWNHDDGQTCWEFAMGVPEAEAAVDYAYEIYPPGPEGLDDQHIALLRGVLEGVEAKLRDDPRYWRAINAIADRLIEHPLHRLDGVEAAAIMKRAWNAP